MTEVESSRTSLASRTSSRTDFEVLGLGLGLEGQVLGLGLEASSPWKLACPRLEDSTIFWKVKILWSGWKIFGKRFFVEIAWKIFVKTFFFFLEIAWKIFVKTFFFFFWRALALCVLGPWPWPRAFLSLASRVSVLGKAVLGLGFFLCPWPWPRALCPRLHLWLMMFLALATWWVKCDYNPTNFFDKNTATNLRFCCLDRLSYQKAKARGAASISTLRGTQISAVQKSMSLKKSSSSVKRAWFPLDHEDFKSVQDAGQLTTSPIG